ncbi:MAG: helix-turn-helix transcriptional regulator [Raoultibacter sp.]
METNRESEMPRMALCLLGLSLYWSWIHSTLFGPSIWQNAAASSPYIWITSLTAHSLGLLIIVLLANKNTPFIERRVWVIGTPVLIVVGVVSMMYGFASVGGMAFVYGGAVLSGLGNAGFMAFLGETYSTIEPGNNQRLLTAASMMVSLLVYLAIVALPQWISLLSVIALPVLVIICLRRAHAFFVDQPRRPPLPQSGRFPISIKLLLYCFVLAIPANLLRSRLSIVEPLYSSASWSIVFSCVLLIVVIATTLNIPVPKKFSSSFLPGITVLLLSAGLLLFPFLPSDKETVACALVFAGHFLLQVYAFVEFGAFSFRNQDQSAKIFVFGNLILNCGLLLGAILGIVLESVSTIWTVGITLGIVYLVFIVGSVFFSKKVGGVEEPIEESSIENLQDSLHTSCVNLTDTIHNQCERIAVRYALSSREAEILEFLAKGRTLNSVGEELHLARNTVKTHVTHIYQKCDVHSREELLKLYETIDAQKNHSVDNEK